MDIFQLMDAAMMPLSREADNSTWRHDGSQLASRHISRRARRHDLPALADATAGFRVNELHESLGRRQPRHARRRLAHFSLDYYSS